MNERDVFREVMDEYQKEGYKIYYSPYSPENPGFMAELGADAIAVKGPQIVLIQTKMRGLSNEDEHPDILTTEEPDVHYARNLLDEVELLLRAETSRAAFLLGWAAAEAAMRALVKQEGINAKTPVQLMETLVERELISVDEFLILRGYMNLRNITAHGLRTSELPTEQTVERLMYLTKRLINRNAHGHKRGRALMSTVVGGSLQQCDDVRNRVKSAPGLLEEIVGHTTGIVRAEWGFAEDAAGRKLITLTLADFVGKVTGTFESEEFENKEHLRFRLRRLWGDLLQIRADRQREEFMKLRHTGAEQNGPEPRTTNRQAYRGSQ